MVSLGLFSLLFLACFSLFSPLFCSAVDEFDSAGAVGPYWLPNIDFIFSGFCFPPELRAVQNFSEPLYDRQLVLGVPFSSELDLINVFIMKILLNEIIGYSVRIVDTTAFANDWSSSIAGPSPSVDFLANSGWLQSVWTRFKKILEFNNENNHFLTYGPQEAFDQGFIFVSHQARYANPGRSFLHWTDWSGGVAPNADFPSITMPYSPEHFQKVQENVEVFRASSWQWLANNPTAILLDPNNPALGPACPPDIYFEPVAGFRAGCNDPNFPSMYIPPQCYPNPQAQCAPVFTFPALIVGALSASLLRNLNLSLIIVYVNIPVIFLPPFSTAQGNFLVLSAAFDTIALKLCTGPGGSTVPCYNPVEGLQFDNRCFNQFRGNYDEEWLCSSPEIHRYKFARRDFPQIAPRADFLLRKLEMTNGDIQNYYKRMVGAQRDYKRVACDWLMERANDSTSWRSWISPPEPCDSSHYSYQIGSCDEKSSFLVEYSWKKPKACQGGLALPPPESISCGFYEADESSYSGLLVGGVMVSLIPGVFLFLLMIQTAFGVSATNASMASRALAISKAFSSKLQKLNSPGVGVSAVARLPVVNQFILCLPVSAAFGPFLSIFQMGCLLLLSVLLPNIGPLTSSRCWARLAVLVMGLVALNLAIASASMKIRQASQRLLNPQNERRALVGVFIGLASSAALLIIAAGTSESLLTENTAVLPSSARLTFQQCRRAPLWLFASLSALNILPAFYPFAVLASLWFRTHIGGSPWFAQLLEVSLVAPSKLTSLNTGSSRANAPIRTRSQLVQLHTLIAAYLISLAALVLIYFNEAVDDDVEQNRRIAWRTGLCAIFIVVALQLALFGPSLTYAFIQYQRLKHKDDKNSNVPAGLFQRFRNDQTVSKTPATAESQASGRPEDAALSVVEHSEQTAEPSAVSSTSLRDSANFPLLTLDGESEEQLDGARELTSLQRVFADPLACLMFTLHAESVFDAENIHFLLDCRRFYQSLQVPSFTTVEIWSELLRLQKEFIEVNSEQQINISASLRGEFEQGMDRLQKTISESSKAKKQNSSAAPLEIRMAARSLLIDSIKEAYGLLQVNSYVRFLQSQHAIRANELILWSEEFFDLTAREQEAMVKRLNKALKTRRREEMRNESQILIDETGTAAGTRNNSKISQSNEPGKSRERRVLSPAFASTPAVGPEENQLAVVTLSKGAVGYSAGATAESSPSSVGRARQTQLFINEPESVHEPAISVTGRLSLVAGQPSLIVSAADLNMSDSPLKEIILPAPQRRPSQRFQRALLKVPTGDDSENDLLNVRVDQLEAPVPMASPSTTSKEG